MRFENTKSQDYPYLLNYWKKTKERITQFQSSYIADSANLNSRIKAPKGYLLKRLKARQDARSFAR